MGQPNSEEIKKLFDELKAYEKRGYFLNPDQEFTSGLLTGLIANEQRYGYRLCPCRLTAGSRQEDMDLICPCDYRDADISEFGNCFCGLYVSREERDNKSAVKPVPERRPVKELRNQFKNMDQTQTEDQKFSQPVWRCTVCGYVCAREDAPDVCPICGASHDRFEKFA